MRCRNSIPLEALTSCGDATGANFADLDRLVAQIKREKGRLDVLFTNPAVAKYAPLGKITEDLYDTIFDVNVKGVLDRRSDDA